MSDSIIPDKAVVSLHAMLAALTRAPLWYTGLDITFAQTAAVIAWVRQRPDMPDGDTLEALSTVVSALYTKERLPLSSDADYHGYVADLLKL